MSSVEKNWSETTESVSERTDHKDCQQWSLVWTLAATSQVPTDDCWDHVLLIVASAESKEQLAGEGHLFEESLPDVKSTAGRRKRDVRAQMNAKGR